MWVCAAHDELKDKLWTYLSWFYIWVCPYLSKELGGSPWLSKIRPSSMPFQTANSRALNQALQPAAPLSSRSGLPWFQNPWFIGPAEFEFTHSAFAQISCCQRVNLSLFSRSKLLGLINAAQMPDFLWCVSYSHRLLLISCASSPQPWYRYLSRCYPMVFLFLIHGRAMSQSPFHFPQLA